MDVCRGKVFLLWEGVFKVSKESATVISEKSLVILVKYDKKLVRFQNGHRVWVLYDGLLRNENLLYGQGFLAKG